MNPEDNVKSTKKFSDYVRKIRDGYWLTVQIPSLGYRDELLHGHYFEPLIFVIAIYIGVTAGGFWGIVMAAMIIISIANKCIHYFRIRKAFSDETIDSMRFLFEHGYFNCSDDYVDEAIEVISEECDKRYLRLVEQRAKKEAKIKKDES